MADIPSHPLYLATNRLVEALNRLEKNLEKMTANREQDTQKKQQLVAFERENESLRQERENLNAAIGQLQYQYNDLHQVASTIYGKLDDSIRRLTRIVES